VVFVFAVGYGEFKGISHLVIERILKSLRFYLVFKTKNSGSDTFLVFRTQKTKKNTPDFNQTHSNSTQPNLKEKKPKITLFISFEWKISLEIEKFFG
jgi:hypothetical protein